MLWRIRPTLSNSQRRSGGSEAELHLPTPTSYSTFLHPTFEADAFAHAVLNGEDYPPPAEGDASNGVPPGGQGFMKGLVGENGTGDVSAALARLNFGVEDLNRQLKGEITKHHSSLLLQAASLGGMEGDLSEVRRGLAEVEGGVSRLKRKIAAPYQALSSSLLLLTRLRRAASLARRAQRFVHLARRLEGQMAEFDGTAGGNGLRSSVGPKTLLTASDGVEPADDDPEALLPLRSLAVVESNIPAIELSRQRVVEEMETSVQHGLTELDHPLLASALQTGHNLSVLPSLVESLVGDLNDLVYRKVKACFDMGSFAREMVGKGASPASSVPGQTLTFRSTGYPRLLRLFQEFFSKIAVHTDTVYTLTQQSPETVLALRAIQPFETLYLTRSTNRLNEAVSSAFSVSSSLASSFSSRPPSVPTANEGLAAARAVVNELDAARFDPLLVKAVATGANRAVDVFVQRTESLIAHDHSATSLLGPLATPSQHQNADLASSLYHLWLPLDRALAEHTESVREVLRPSVNRLRSTYLGIANPLIMAIRREFSSLLARMHRVDYSKELDLASGPMMAGGASSYMVDLTDKLALIKEEILGAYRVGELAKEWALDLARFTVQTFLLHASIVQPLGESGKLKLTSDVTSLEFAVSQYLAAQGLALSSMGDQFKALRERAAFRPLLFLDTPSLLVPSQTPDIPALILLHHLVSRSSLPLPHRQHGWSEAEYVRWLNEHGEGERVGMVEDVVKAWEERNGEDAGEGEEKEWVRMVRVVLARAKGARGEEV
ncbi:SPOSA6832_01618, partial [Sporobolomyces salmonicolor]